MTLVVAKILDQKIYIESDTKITGHSIVRNDDLKGNIKALILEPRLCLCYAGNVHFAEVAYIHFMEKSKTTIAWNDFIQHLFKLHQESNQETDFILACLESSGPLLIEIKDGKATQTQSSWIGDKDSFNEFQKHFLADRLNEVEDHIQMHKAFEIAFRSDRSDAVGGFQISVYTDTKSAIVTETKEPYPILRYKDGTSLISGRPKTLSFEGKNQPSAIPIEGASEGAYFESLFVTTGDSPACLAIHLGYAKCSLFFPPADLLNGELYTDMTGEEFVKEIYVQKKLKLAGFQPMPGTMGMKFIVGGAENCA
ncbi:MAG: hypothetical protein ABJG68_02660 [Crocinitomicaceae bacterium]